MSGPLSRACIEASIHGHKASVTKFFIRGFKYQHTIIKDEEFRALVIPGHTEVPQEIKKERRQRPPVPPPRFRSMPVDQDWPNAWPTAKSATWSVIPFPVRQGQIQKTENQGFIPAAYGNAELMKIPNFLHLTPGHVKRQCAAIKQFCTEWPKELDTLEACQEHFPVTVTTCDYVFDGPSIKDERAREVLLTVSLADLKLDYHARDKLIRLAGKAYDRENDALYLKTDRCPTKKQNYDYVVYLLTALYKESCKTEAWEAGKTLQDMEEYFWDINKSKNNIIDTIKRINFAAKGSQHVPAPACVQNLNENPSDEDVLALTEVKNYKTAAENLMNTESVDSVSEYKDAVKKLLNLK